MTLKKPDQSSGPSVAFWAQIYHRDEIGPGTVLCSPGFNTQLELTAWIQKNRRGDEVVYPYRRSQTERGFTNDSLLVP